ncbi:MAG: hypothetical protein LC734_00555 [Acidobacteria bacterium]|nr:hypothetical protein [Acidobacteriota bacterium]
MHFVFGKYSFLVVLNISVLLFEGCAAKASQREPNNLSTAKSAATSTIDIKPGSPSETVRAFYEHLRGGRIREAIFLTNLRPAIEGLTDAELREFKLDFEQIAVKVPANLEINGEFISGDSATVTAKLPNNDDLEKSEFQRIRLRRDGKIWIILTVDQAAETVVKKEGKNYFRSLRITAHEDDAREMLQRIAKAQIAHTIQNRGLFADISALVAAGFLPEDIKSSESTGYRYVVVLIDGGKIYEAAARPAEYGKSGKLTFYVRLDENGRPRLTSTDEGPPAARK